MENKGKVLLIGPMPPPSGGVSIHLFRLLEKSSNYPNLELAVFDLKKGKLFYGNGKIKNVLAGTLYFLHADILHIHLSHPIKVFIAKAGRFLGKKIIYTQHNIREVELSSTKKIIKLAHRVIYVFGNEKDDNVIPAYIPSNDNRPLDKEFINLLEKNDKVIVSLCTSPVTEKNEIDIYGFDIILDAIELLPELKGLALILVDANNTYRERYAEKIRSLVVQKKLAVIYTSSDINFASLISRSKIYIRASRSDGDSISVREALHQATPVLASNCVTRPEGCILIQSGDPRHLADQIYAVLSNYERRNFCQKDNSERIFKMYLE